MENNHSVHNIYTAAWEYTAQEKDRFNRVLHTNCPYDYSKPQVSTYLFECGFRPEYPGRKNFAVCLSHDIDRLFEKRWSVPTFVNQQMRSLFRFDFNRFGKNFTHLNRQVHPDFHPVNIIEKHKTYGISSTAFFLSLNKDDEDYNYDTGEVRGIYHDLLACGNEIGLHGGHEAYLSFDRLVREKEDLEKNASVKITGYRNHYLKFDINTSWANLERAGFEYDATFGFAGAAGFRNGMCHPFVPYNLPARSYHRLVEVPLLLMDATLMRYLGMNVEQAFIHVVRLVESVEKVNGVFSMLWHNNYMTGEWGDFYSRVVEHLHEKNAWFATHKEMVNWYKQNDYFKQQQEILGLAH